MDRRELPKKKNKGEQEERGLKKSTDDWETFARDLKAGAGRRREEHKKANVREDLSSDAMLDTIGAAGFSESAVKYDEAVEKVMRPKTDGELYDAISGEALDGELIKKAREVEMETSRKARSVREGPEGAVLEGHWEGLCRSEVDRCEQERHGQTGLITGPDWWRR